MIDEPILDKAEVEKLIDKWKGVLPGSTPHSVLRTVALHLESQDRCFEALDPKIMRAVEEHLGPRRGIYAALAYALARSPLHWMVSIQPVLAPFAKVAYYEPKFGPPMATSPTSAVQIPSVTLNVNVRDVTASTRGLNLSVPQGPGQKAFDADTDEALYRMFSEAMDQLAREILGETLLSCTDELKAPGGLKTPTGSSLQEVIFNRNDPDQSIVIRISTASQIIHRRSMRAPANWLLISLENIKLLEKAGPIEPADPSVTSFLQKLTEQIHYGDTHQVKLVGHYMRKWNVITDPLFPTDRILLGYTGPSILDTGYVWAPLHFPFTLNSKKPHPWWRGSGVLARPEFYSTVKII